MLSSIAIFSFLTVFLISHFGRIGFRVITLSDTHIDILFGGHGHVVDAIEYFILSDGILDVAKSLLNITNEILPLLHKIDFSVCLMMTDICRTPVRGNPKSRPIVPPVIDKNKRQFFFIRSAGPKQFAHEMPRRFGVFSYYFSELLVDRDFQIEADAYVDNVYRRIIEEVNMVLDDVEKTKGNTME